MDSLPVWVYVVLALFAGLFGNQFLGRVLELRLKHVQGQEQTERELQGSLLAAVINMVQAQSRDLTDLLKDSLRANQIVANNIGQLAMSMDGQGRDGQNQFLVVRDKLDDLGRDVNTLTRKLDDTNAYIVAVVRAIGGDPEVTLPEIGGERPPKESPGG